MSKQHSSRPLFTSQIEMEEVFLGSVANICHQVSATHSGNCHLVGAVNNPIGDGWNCPAGNQFPMSFF